MVASVTNFGGRREASFPIPAFWRISDRKTLYIRYLMLLARGFSITTISDVSFQ